MPAAQPSLFARDDTFLGVCQGLGEDFGFNPNWLRVALAVALFWAPVGVIAGYLVAGVIVLISRWLYPTRVVEVAKAESLAMANDEGAAPTAIAA